MSTKMETIVSKKERLLSGGVCDIVVSKLLMRHRNRGQPIILMIVF